MKKIFGIGWYDIPMILLVMSYTLLSCSVIYWVLYCIVSYLVARYNALLNISIFRHFLPFHPLLFHLIPFRSTPISFPFPFRFLSVQLNLFYSSIYSEAVGKDLGGACAGGPILGGPRGPFEEEAGPGTGRFMGCLTYDFPPIR